MPQEAVKLFRELILAGHRGDLPLHPHIKSYYVEKLNISGEEAESRVRGTNKMFGHPDWDKPPEFEEKHEQGRSTLIVSDPMGLLLYEKKGRLYKTPINWELYRHLGQKIAQERGLKYKEELKPDDKKNLLYIFYHFIKE